MVRFLIIVLMLTLSNTMFGQDTIYLNQKDGLKISTLSKNALGASDSIKTFSAYKENLEKRVIAWVTNDEPDSAKIGAGVIALIDSALKATQINYNLAERLLEINIQELYIAYNLEPTQYELSVSWTPYGALFFFMRKKE